MIAVDVFSRFVHAEPAKAASAEEAVRIFSSWPKPQMLDTDGGPEWKGVFHAMLERNGVAHRIKSPQDTNALAVCDRKIQQIKTAISGRIMEEGEKIGRPSCLTWSKP